MTDCDNGTNAAPNTPCNRRNRTICSRPWAAPQSIEANVKPTTEVSSTRLRPKRLLSMPVSGMQMAAAHRWHSVLNSLSVDFIAVSFASLGERGVFVEIGKRGVWSTSRKDATAQAARSVG